MKEGGGVLHVASHADLMFDWHHGTAIFRGEQALVAGQQIGVDPVSKVGPFSFQFLDL